MENTHHKSVADICGEVLASIEQAYWNQKAAFDAQLKEARPFVCHKHNKVMQLDAAESVRRRMLWWEPCPDCVAEHTMNRLLGMGVPRSNIHCRLTNYVPATPSQAEALEIAKHWAVDQSGVLILCGPSPGVGKTHLATGILANTGGRFIAAMDFLASCRPGANGSADEYFAIVARTKPVLVLDDLGYGVGSKPQHPAITALIMARHANRLPLIITAGMTSERLLDYVGPGPADRIREHCFVCQISGPSHRAAKGKQTHTK